MQSFVALQFYPLLFLQLLHVVICFEDVYDSLQLSLTPQENEAEDQQKERSHRGEDNSNSDFSLFGLNEALGVVEVALVVGVQYFCEFLADDHFGVVDEVDKIFSA